MGTVLHPESGSHSSHPRTGNAEAALSETDIPGSLFSPCQNLPVEDRLPELHLFSALPGDSGFPGQWLPLSKDNNCHWKSYFSPASAARFHTHKISHCTAGHSAWYTARNRIRSVRSGNIHFYGIISMVNSYNDKSPHPFWFFLFFSSRWSFGLEKEKKGRTPKSPARNKKYRYVYLQINTHSCIPSFFICQSVL